MTDAAVTMDFHPQPAAGQAKPWAFPAPERGGLGNGLTVLRCHRPGQQVVAVEICLDVPLDVGARRARRDRHDHGGCAVPRAPASTPPRSSPPSWSAAARPSTRAPTTWARASRWRFPSPAWPGRSACSPRRCRRPRSRPARSSGWCATVSTRFRSSWPTPPGGPPGSSRRSCSRRPPGCPGRARAPRTPSRGSTRRGCARFTRRTCGPPPRPRSIVGDLTGADLDAVLAGTLGEWTGDRPPTRCPRRR